jgi:hypothetical protein
MKGAIITLLLSTVAIALPQGPALGSASTTPTTTTSPRVIGQLPKDGLKGVPFQDFGELASQLGFDPAKATPDPSG